MVIVALLVDLGRPERIWHMIIYQNGHSVLLEIGLCVMLYTTVLALEFLPVLLERPNREKPLRILHGITLPLVILGVVLSTLHQSSLGSLFLSMPEKLNPPWYSPLLPLFFFISAVGVGQAMVIFESSISSRAFQRGLEIDLLGKLAQAILYVLGVYLVLRFGDLGVEGKLALLFWLEVTVGAVLPIIWFARRVNRANPHLMEFAISFGIISAGILTFGVVAKYFPLFEYGAHAAGHATAQPVPSPVTVPATARSEAT